jgi:6-phosphofructokinase
VRLALGNGWETFGVRNGYLGLVEGGQNIAPLGPRDVGGILGLGGTFLARRAR